MIGHNLFATTLVSKLKANSALTTWLAARSSALDIREMSWQGRDFQYPNVRVDTGTETTLEDGPCYGTRSQFAFRLLSFSEGISSQEVHDLALLVHNVVFNTRLTGSGWTTTLIMCDSWPRAIRTPDDIWRCIASYRCQINGGVS
jgi:hypothetical protein